MLVLNATNRFASTSHLRDSISMMMAVVYRPLSLSVTRNERHNIDHSHGCDHTSRLVSESCCQTQDPSCCCHMFALQDNSRDRLFLKHSPFLVVAMLTLYIYRCFGSYLRSITTLSSEVLIGCVKRMSNPMTRRRKKGRNKCSLHGLSPGSFSDSRRLSEDFGQQSYEGQASSFT